MISELLFGIIESSSLKKTSNISSRFYPNIVTDKLEVSPAVIVSGDLKTVVFEVPLNYEIQISTATILSAVLENVAPPNVENSYPPEFIAISEPTIISAELRTVVINYNNYAEEQITMSSATVLSGTLTTVVVNNTAPEESLTLTAATILSGTLT